MNHRDKKTYSLVFLLCLSFSAFAQNDKTLSLPKAISMAQDNSLQAKVIQTTDQVKYFEYVQFKSDLRPQVTFQSELPSYSKTFTPVIQPNGSLQYLAVRQNTNTAGFSLSQLLPITEGTLSVNTQLSHFYDFQRKYNQFNGTPIFLKYDQPFFALKALKWRKIIEPLKLEESKRTYVKEMEIIAQKVTQLYFDVIVSENNIVLATTNLRDADENFLLEKKRILLGTTSEDKILQLQLRKLNGEQNLVKANYSYKNALASLESIIGNKVSGTMLRLPDKITELNINTEDALRFSKKFRPEYIEFERKIKEAQRDIEAVNGDKKQVKLSASYGLNRASTDLATIYNNPKSQQIFALSIAIPIVDWGRNKVRMQTSKANEKLVKFTIESENLRIENEIVTLINNINLYNNNIKFSRQADSVAMRRYILAGSLYQKGKLSITELNIAQQEKDEAIRDYIFSLNTYWNAFYLLRALTLYDFESQQPITNGFIEYKKRVIN